MKRSSLKAKSISNFLDGGKRPAQEDFVLTDREKNMFVVADGFGGPLPGSEASKSACESIRAFLFKEAGDLEATLPFVLRSYFSLAGNVLFNALVHANRKLLQLNKGRNVHECGGASVIAGFVDGDLLAIANAGACSAWLFREDQSIELVIPRTYSKLCDPFLKKVTLDQQIPLMALGIVPDLEPEIVEVRLKEGDWVVLATDGINPSLIEEISGLRQKRLSSEESVRAFSELAKSSEYEDNAAACLVVF